MAYKLFHTKGLRGHRAGPKRAVNAHTVEEVMQGRATRSAKPPAPT
jgi:hypothetical protein